MADNNNNDPQDYDDTYVEDDFEQVADDNVASDDWSDDFSEDLNADETQDSASPPPSKKKSTLATIIVVAVSAILIVGVLALMGGGEEVPVEGASVETPASPDAAVTGPDQPVGIAPPAADATQVPAVDTTQPARLANANENDQGFMVNPSEIKDSPVDAPAPIPLPAPVDAPPPVAELPPTEPPPAMMTAPDQFPTVDKILKPQPDTPVPAAPTVPAVQESAPVPDATAVPAPAVNNINEDTIRNSAVYKDMAGQLADAQSKIAALQKSIDEQKVHESRSEDIEGLKNRIAELESKLLTAAAAPRESPAIESQAPKSVKAKRATPAVSLNVMTSSWHLKSATPDRAVVANTRTGDIRTVHIGEDLAPIGRVTAIEMRGSRWVVQGTHGRVTQ